MDILDTIRRFLTPDEGPPTPEYVGGTLFQATLDGARMLDESLESAGAFSRHPGARRARLYQAHLLVLEIAPLDRALMLYCHKPFVARTSSVLRAALTDQLAAHGVQPRSSTDSLEAIATEQCELYWTVFTQGNPFRLGALVAEQLGLGGDPRVEMLLADSYISESTFWDTTIQRIVAALNEEPGA